VICRDGDSFAGVGARAASESWSAETGIRSRAWEPALLKNGSGRCWGGTVLRKLFGRREKEITIYTQPTWADCHAAKRFLAEHDIPFTEKDVTTDHQYMDELKSLVGRFITPTLVIDGETLLGFGTNIGRVRELLRKELEMQ
jgi:glutaredoxin